MKKRTKEEMREYQQQRRVLQKGVTTNDNVTPKKMDNVTPEKWYPNKATDEMGKPIKPITLSDGQLWYPKPGTNSINEDIERYGKVKGDLGARRARAERYNTNEPALLSAIVNDRKRLVSITSELKSHNQLDNVRYGLSGPTMGQVAKMLEITG
jgi:hypothetical protein